MWLVVKNIYHLFKAIAANILYGFPSRGMIIIGVTGTEGKTTTSSLIYHILNQAGYKTSLVSTVSAIISGKSLDTGFHVTTPSPFAIQKYLKKAKKAGSKYFVLEVSSHGLDQHRPFGINFAVGVVTNITPEHLDYHKTYEKYLHAKAKLLRNAKIAIINKDDRSYLKLKNHELRNKDKKIITYGLKKDSDVNIHNFHFKTKLIGNFNKYNCLAAAAVLHELHIPDEIIRSGIASFKAPIGRQEVIYDKHFKVMIDFATNANSFRQILSEVKKITKGRLIHMFGSAGERDVAKRAATGKASSEYADIIVITAEDPRSEGAEKINSQILSGINTSKFKIQDSSDVSSLGKNGKYVFQTLHRKDGVNLAIALAQKGDTVLLTGKGHEQSMNYGQGEESWDEKEAALEAIKNKNKN